MAIITASIQKQANRDKVATWTPLLNGDSGSVLTNVGNTYATVQVSGTFGVGGSITLQGSLDGVTYQTLLDNSGAVVTFTAAGMVTVRDIVLYYKPLVTAGDGTTALTCNLLVR
jgi:hypothetical protein